MNTTLPPSDMPEEPDFNGFGSYRRKRKPRDAGDAAPRRSFRRIPRDGFQETDAAGDHAGDGQDAGETTPRRHFRKFGEKGSFGKNPFGKKPFGRKKPFDRGEPGPGAERPSFRDFADTIDEGEVPPPRHDRSFKNAAGRAHGNGGGFQRPRKPFGGKLYGKKPFGKFRPFPGKRPSGDGDDEAPRPPRAIRRPYGMDGDDVPFEDAPPPPRKPFRKPFGKKPFAKKPFGKKPFHSRKPFDAPSGGMAPDDAPAPFGGKPYGRKPFGKKPFGKKPFGKGKPSGGKPFGKKPFGKGKPFGKKPFGPKRPPFRG